MNINFKRWSVVFKALSNINRLKIVQLLFGGAHLNVGDISREIRISITATSNHLVLLQKLDVLESIGKDGHVFYFLSSDMPRDFREALDLFTKRK